MPCRAENEALLAELEGAREAARALKMEHEEAVEELRLLRTSKRSRAGSMCGEDFEGQVIAKSGEGCCASASMDAVL